MTRPAPFRWPWVLGTLVLVVLTVTAFQGTAPLVSPEALTFAVIGAIGLFILRAVSMVAKKATTAFGQFENLLATLYGAKDGNGVYTNDGALGKIDRITVAVERIPELEDKINDAVVQAATAASAAQTAQKMAAAAIAGDRRDPRTRTRAADRDDT